MQSPAHMSALYRFFHYLAVPLVLRLWTRLRVEGREHIPATGPLIVVSNHVANLDSYIIGLFVRDRVIHYMARADGLGSRWLGWYWRQFGAIPADRDGVREALAILRAGGAVGIFPEGVIAPALVAPLPGSALLALRSGAIVVPAAIWGSERVGPLSLFNPPRVAVRYGPPRILERRRGALASQDAADDLMREIAAMLPPRYRGVYATGGADRAGVGRGTPVS